MEIREYTESERKVVLNKAIAKYGENQLDIAQEELSELIQAISKVKRYPNSKDAQLNLIEEIADVSIMIEQLQMYFGISNQTVLDEIDCKLDRLEDGMFEEDAREFYKNYLNQEEDKIKEFKINTETIKNINEMMGKASETISNNVNKIINPELLNELNMIGSKDTKSIEEVVSQFNSKLQERMPKED